MKKVFVISLGCDKNRVDTENMLFFLNKGGFSLCDDIEKAEIIIVNTCAFLESARKEAIEVILESAEYKKKSLEKLVVTGCFPQKYLSELEEGFPEVDAFLGIDEYQKLPNIIHSLYGFSENFTDFPQGRILTTMPHYAYVKVADGCNNYCSYCLIPSIRGRYRSRKIEDIITECEKLSDSGVKEFILVAQDLTRYGYDIYQKYMLPVLIERISEIKCAEWIRLLYCYPELVTDELIYVLKNNPKVCKYIDIPMQHISDNVLKDMNRRGTNEKTIALIEKLRDKCPDIAIRSTFISGFPTETEDDHRLLVEFLRTYKIDRAGFFAFSAEEGTRAFSMKKVFSKERGEERLQELINVQAEISLSRNREKIGKIMSVRYEGIDYERSLFYGRSQFEAPDVDGKIFFGAKRVEIGNVYDIIINDCDEYDLVGGVIENELT